MVAFRKAGLVLKRVQGEREEIEAPSRSRLLAAGVFGDSLGPLRDGVLG